jgi:hypothetical protein
MESMPSRSQIHQMAARWLPDGSRPEDLRIHTDTSDFFALDAGDVVVLDGRPYLVRNSIREGRFGLEDEIKFWVKRAIDLVSGAMRIIKFVFYERFEATIGGITFECFRSPRKEARILELVKDHPNFMHGLSAADEKGNIVRVLETISGPTLAAHVTDVEQDHETYFFSTLPGILGNYLGCIEAIRFLHDHGEKHGDIRRDHILIDSESGRYRWIDFDYNYRHRENMYGYDLFGLGNVLIYLVGKGDVLLPDLSSRNPGILSRLNEGDMNIVFHNRLANLQKVFAYIPDSLNRILLHFSRGANWFYEKTPQLLQDLCQAETDIR